MAETSVETLKGRRILVVEDEMLLAMDLQGLLEDHGCKVIGPVPNVDKALDAIAAQDLDAATLDLNLNGTCSAPIAAALRDRGIPFVLVSGYGEKHCDEAEFKDAPVVKKPYDTQEFLRKLSGLLG